MTDEQIIPILEFESGTKIQNPDDLLFIWLDHLKPLFPKDTIGRRKTRPVHHLSRERREILLPSTPTPKPDLPDREPDLPDWEPEQGSKEEREREGSTREEDQPAPVAPVESPRVPPPTVSAPSVVPLPDEKGSKDREQEGSTREEDQQAPVAPVESPRVPPPAVPAPPEGPLPGNYGIAPEHTLIDPRGPGSHGYHRA